MLHNCYGLLLITLQDKTENTKQQQQKEETEEVLIDFREYLLSALFIIKFKQPAIQLIKLAFKVCDKEVI